jgi:membrane-bound metal-dependent hydrolase YbcI (DUF457 family)
MSGIGHLAVGLAAQPGARQVPLWVWLVACETNDLLYCLFTATGIEKPVATTVDFQQGVRYLTAGTNPWSHGLGMSLVWALAAAGLGWLVYRQGRPAVMIGLVVFSHWGLDFLMHSNLPLFLSGSPQVGLGLENSGPGFIFITILDLALLTGGIAIYLAGRKHLPGQTKKSKI